MVIIAAIIANILWGSTFMASKLILAESSPITAVLCRFTIAIIFFGVTAIFKREDVQWDIIKTRYIELIGLGLVGYAGLYMLQMAALQYITSSQSAAIMLLAPIFTLLLESYFRKTIKLREVLMILTGLFGASIILFDHQKIHLSGITSKGLWMTVLAAVCLGVSVIQAKQLMISIDSKKGFTVFNLTFYSMTIGFIGLLPLFFESPSGLHLGTLSRGFWFWTSYLGILCSVGAFLMWNWSIKQVSPTVVAVTMYLKTPVALGIGAVVLGEHLTTSFYGGTLLIFGALLANQLAQSVKIR